MRAVFFCFCSLAVFCLSHAAEEESRKNCLHKEKIKVPITKKKTDSFYTTQRYCKDKVNPKDNKNTKCKHFGISKVKKTKIVTATKTVEKFICCTGHTYVEVPGESLGTCVPVCQPLCPDGAECVDTNKCECKSPLVPDASPPTVCLETCPEKHTRNESGCIPVCDNCDHGTCVAPDTCQCQEGYVNRDGDLTKCEPKCPENCNPGHCEIPGNCTCDLGYEDLESGCTPICKTGCPNGRCIAPDKCECNEGFRIKNSICVPHCDNKCTNGFCIEPNVCGCNEGFQMVSGTCEPICSRTCINGKCYLPDTCLCDSEYKKDEQDPFACRPICEVPCGDGGRCAAPNQCSCYPGFKLDSSGACAPVCSEPCVNGECTSADTCSCLPSYTAISKYACAPVCSPSCANATCTRPGVCSCLDGYKQYNDWMCTPKCDNCRHGSCVSPGICKCNEGYRMVNDSCEPECVDDCRNGTCVSPHTCECYAGYYIVNSTCHPKCSDKCVNGICTAPETCRCILDYTQDETNTYICRKPCLQECIMGECSVHGVCECPYGYKLGGDQSTCEPICDPTCVNGICNKPGRCECVNGYELTNSSHVCKKICDKGCHFGDCNQEGICDCFHGYVEEDCSVLFRPNCSFCDGNCTELQCACANGTLCDGDYLDGPFEFSPERYTSGNSFVWVYGAAAFLICLTAILIAKKLRKKNSSTANLHTDCQNNFIYRGVAPFDLDTLHMRETTVISDELERDTDIAKERESGHISDNLASEEINKKCLDLV